MYMLYAIIQCYSESQLYCMARKVGYLYTVSKKRH